MSGQGAQSSVQAVVHRYVERMRTDYLSALRDVLPAGDAALVDVPNHGNPGDAAILLGELRALQVLGVRTSYVADQRGYHPAALARANPHGPILVHGGGNFGDLYPRHLSVRLRVLHDFPDRTVIHLPQSVYFRDESRAREVAATVVGHAGSVVFARDAQSANRLQDHGIKCRLAPDAAFVLGPQPRHHPATEPVGFLQRTDREATPGESPPDLATFDWPHPTRAGECVRWAGRFGSFALQQGGVLTAPLQRPVAFVVRELAMVRMAAGLRALERYELLLTDRLHGHVLAALVGIPTRILGSETGKVVAFLDTWRPPVEAATRVEHAEEFVGLEHSHCAAPARES